MLFAGGSSVKMFLALSAVTSLLVETHPNLWMAITSFTLLDHYVIRADDDVTYLLD